MRQEDIEKILEVGVMLSSERSLDRLLERILICVMELANCDAGTLYLLDQEKLHFRIMRNNTLKAYSGGDGREPELPPVELSRGNVCALALLEGRVIRIEDVRHCQEYDFSGPAQYDAITGYHTQSMLVVPMRNRAGENLGVLQLINALDADGNVCAFAKSLVLAVESVASQAAITIQNVRYLEEIKDLFHSFVHAMSTAVDERTPYNGSHPRHMAAYGNRFMDFLNTKDAKWHFSAERREELLMSIWLHDIGKLVTPLEVMNKMTRLLPEQHTAFTHRMEVIRLKAEIEYLRSHISLEEKEEIICQTQEAAALVNQSDDGKHKISDAALLELGLLREKTYLGEDGLAHPWLSQEEYQMLSIQNGTLSEEERKTMEEHVIVTDKLLSQIRFPSDLSHVREWASAHHELLNGTGYPHHKQGDAIPFEVRIITILDIFDALVATDRPYKEGMPIEKALSILTQMALKEGKLDPELVELFIESKCWENMEFLQL